MAPSFHFHSDPGSKREDQRSLTPARAAALLVRWLWPVIYGVLLVILIIAALTQLARAGEPRLVAGSSYFDSGIKGTPLTWAQGTINYYTDAGDLSPLLPQAAADALVATALGRWTSIATAALVANHGGTLAEDVNGSNVFVNADGTISMPADILPSATSKPLAIVYDANGAVTDALLGLGAGGSDSCFTNAVFGGDPDNLSSDGHILHALVVVNGNCAQTSAQVPDVQYRLVRVLGRALGLDWSQVNINVITRNPIPTSADYAGFPVMHSQDSQACVPISICYSNADQPKTDDQAAISRLYPVTAQDISGFQGKQILADNTVRIHGSVYFTNSGGQATQPMQGVNVVARWIDPSTGQASRTYAASCVSGFLFRGYAGNPVTGFTDSLGRRYDQFGSDDPVVEGFFDLAGLPIPDGSNAAQYQLTVEALDTIWSETVGPYDPWQVQPSGSAPPITVTVNKGADVAQDILMSGSSQSAEDWFASTDFVNPAILPASGSWTGKLNSYGETEYFRFTGQANRTMSVQVTALDETSVASEVKGLPVIGIWALADPPGTDPPSFTPFAFNTLTFGMTQLDSTLLASTDFRIGISDFRGDGRPDYQYQARVFYGDSVTPVRASVRGGTPITINGMGFGTSATATVGNASASVLSTTPNQILAAAPAGTDGVANITLADPSGGVSSIMTGVLTYGASSTDMLKLLSGANPSVPVGTQAPVPFRVQVMDATGTTPIEGASVAFSSTPAAGFSACAGLSSCTVLTDETGEATTWVTVLSNSPITVTAKLAPASYPNPKLVQATIPVKMSALDIAVTAPYQFIAQGATLDIPFSARVVSNGVGVSGRTVKFQVVKGSGTLTISSINTDGNGYATTTLHVAALAGDVQVSACAEPGDAPCDLLKGTAVPASQLKVQAVSGNLQMVNTGVIFQPVVVRVTDLAAVPDLVRGASVLFQWLNVRKGFIIPPRPGGGDTIVTHQPTPVILGSGQTTLLSDLNGLATMQPAVASSAMEIDGAVSAGAGSVTYTLQALAGAGTGRSVARARKGGRSPE